MFQTERRLFRYLSVLVLFTLLSIAVTSCLPSPFNQEPIAMATTPTGIPYGPAPLTVTFNISESTDPDGEIVSFALDFADGSEPVSGTDLSVLITHTYSSSGQYFATLTVVDDDGVEDRVQILISVTEE